MKPSKEDFQLGDRRPEWRNSLLPNSEFYVERPLVTTRGLHGGLMHRTDSTPSFITVEAACHEAILQPGALLRIKGAKQMGKTSLLVRLSHQNAQQNFDVALLSLKVVETSILQDIDSLLRWFCQQVTAALQLPNRLDDYWDDLFGSSISCKSYFEEYLLLQSSQPLVLALDDVDRLFPYIEVADEFLGLLRAWHEDARTRDVWKKVRLVLSHTADVYIPLNLHKSPFNVGVPIELLGFTQAQVQTLAQCYGLSLSTEQLGQLQQRFEGQPYLTQLALQALQQQMQQPLQQPVQ